VANTLSTHCWRCAAPARVQQQAAIKKISRIQNWFYKLVAAGYRADAKAKEKLRALAFLNHFNNAPAQQRPLCPANTLICQPCSAGNGAVRHSNGNRFFH
jgi:hypothetical protein